MTLRFALVSIFITMTFS